MLILSSSGLIDYTTGRFEVKRSIFIVWDMYSKL